ncbi:EamA family transporter [Planktothrix pseudagardhii]|uniref:Transporter YojE n=1 Tax=Planktothrix pseudagardhii TaxID=132604 RepID=A0A9W4CIT9_9CYAN|nr:EamA family transporter [Planktothrix pseudagardhii]CAD5939962.1 putative transporter YojE [Planktothrix pseudagardhii]
MRQKFTGIFYAIIAPLFYGLLPLFWRFVSLPTLDLISYRCLFTFAILGVILLITGQWVTVRNFSLNVIMKVAKSAFYLATHLGFFMGAIALGHQVEAAIGMFLAPAATAVLSTILLGEKLNTIKRLCVGISVFSAIIFFYEAQEIPHFAVFIALTWGLYLCERKHALKMVNNPLAYSWLEQSLIAGVLIVILNSVFPANIQPLTAVNSSAFLVLGGGCTLATIASFLQSKASQMIDCSQVGMLGVLSPVVQFTVAVLVDQKPVSLLQLTAIMLLLIAVVLYNCPPLKNPTLSKAN